MLKRLIETDKNLKFSRFMISDLSRIALILVVFVHVCLSCFYRINSLTISIHHIEPSALSSRPSFLL